MKATYIDENGTSYDLPKWTMKLAKLQDEAETESSTNEAMYRKQYVFLKNVYDKKTIDEMLDGKTIDDIDLTSLNVLYIKTSASYKKNIDEVNEEIQNEKLVQFERMADAIGQIGNVTNLIDMIPKK